MKDVRVSRHGIEMLRYEPSMSIGLAKMAEQALIKYGFPAAPIRLGHYIRGLGVGVIGSQVVITSSDFKTWWIEKGTLPHRTRPVGTPAFRVLEKTARKAGWKYTEL